jgi:serine O-acetyltransferase
MRIVDVEPDFICSYIVRQLDSLFPDDNNEHEAAIRDHIREALQRTFVCVRSVKMWKPEEFDYLHTSQYLTLLYFLSNTIWRRTNNRTVCSKIFALNKTLNGIDLFYEIEMPAHFFVGHSVGIVLAKAQYGDYLVLYQNSTVGRHFDRYPRLGEGIIIYPNSAIVGSCKVLDNTVLSLGSRLVDVDTPGNCVVESGAASMPTFRPLGRRYADDYFRIG